MAAPSVDVAIVAYRHWELTSSCLRHLAAQTRAHRVYVLDNGCDEGTAERVRAEFPDVRVERLEQNAQFAVACNRVVAAGDGDFVVIMNNDVDARPDFLERLVAPLEAAAHVGSVAAVLLSPGEQVIDSLGIVADATLAPFAHGQGRDVSLLTEELPVLAAADGATAAYRRDVWEQLGGIDEELPHHDDFELGLRIQAAGWRVTLAEDAVAVHLRSATRAHQTAFRRHGAGFGRGYILRRYGVLRSRAAPRALATEALVATADAVISRDLAALRGRVDGWRAAGGRSPRPGPGAEALDERISFAESMRLRRGVSAPKTG